ncbi:MAG TPA: ABC transporter permease [Vicinamibacterales bacterium]|nr:ABC transporter permease [Vicinamibacterales bacterium]
MLVVRSLRRSPLAAAVIVGSIAIGIGVNTVVFSWIQSRVGNPIPGSTRGGDFKLIEFRGDAGSSPASSWQEYRDLQARVPALDELIAFRMAPLNVGHADRLERTYGLLVSGNYFQGLGLSAETGRLIDANDTAAPGATPVVVISRRFWEARLARAPGVIGAVLRINDRPFTVIGVAPAPFQGTVMGLTFDLWIPATAAPLVFEGTRELDARTARDYELLGHVRAGVNAADAGRQLDDALRAMAADYPGTNASVRADLLPQWRSPHGPQQSLMLALGLLQGVMLLVLAAVAGNMANLVLARTTARRKEAAIMLALGAGRWRIARLVLIENVVLALAGAAVGAVLAVWGANALRAVPLPTPAGLALTFFTPVDWVSVAFACGLGVLSGLLIGLPPAWQLARTDPAGSLRATGASAARRPMRDILLGLEAALAIVVLVVAALFLKSFRDTQTIDPGFRGDGVLLASYDLRGRVRAIDPLRSLDFAARLLDRLRQTPAVQDAALALSVPLDIHGMPSRAYRFEGQARADGSTDEALTNTVSPGYFATMAIPIIAGGDFADLRDQAAPPQAIVNEAFARQFGKDSQAVVGRRIVTDDSIFTIAGVVRDSVAVSFGEVTQPLIYLSWRDRPSPAAEIHVRTRGDLETAIAPAVRAAVAQLDATLPLYNVRTLTAHVDANQVFRRVPARMFVVLGPLVLLLMAAGIYAVVAHAVAQRRREIATRAALGATARQIRQELTAETMRAVLMGMAAGGVVALMIDPLAVGGRVDDTLLLAGVAVVFVGTAWIASWWPARAASAVDPISALKD